MIDDDLVLIIGLITEILDIQELDIQEQEGPGF